MALCKECGNCEKCECCGKMTHRPASKVWPDSETSSITVTTGTKDLDLSGLSFAGDDNAFPPDSSPPKRP